VNRTADGRLETARRSTYSRNQRIVREHVLVTRKSRTSQCLVLVRCPRRRWYPGVGSRPHRLFQFRYPPQLLLDDLT